MVNTSKLQLDKHQLKEIEKWERDSFKRLCHKGGYDPEKHQQVILSNSKKIYDTMQKA